MRRDHFTLQTANVDPQTTAPPTLVLTYEGPAENLTARLTEEKTLPEGDDVDAAFRLHDPVDAADAAGVFSLTRRLTGEYLLEANAPAADVLELAEAAREENGVYPVRIGRPGAEDPVFDKETLLVYDRDGSLLRGDSLIPGGVEL
jgi:hypothetical protein